MSRAQRPLDLIRLGAAGIETVGGKSFADDVAIGHHPDQLVVLADRNAADIMRSHQLCDFGNRRVGTDPVDAIRGTASQKAMTGS